MWQKTGPLIVANSKWKVVAALITQSHHTVSFSHEHGVVDLTLDLKCDAASLLESTLPRVTYNVSF